MPRYAPIITMDELKKKLDPLISNNDDDGFPDNLPSKAINDIKKVEFDIENLETGYNPDWVVEMGDPRYHNEGYSNYFCGYHTLPNNLPVLFINAGGDWEFPVCFIIYWDGKSLRGYIPTKGNRFDIKTKCAYDGEVEVEPPNNEEIIDDIMNRIIIR